MEYYTATKKNQGCLKENQIVKSQRLGKSAMNPSSGHDRALATEELTAAMTAHKTHKRSSQSTSTSQHDGEAFTRPHP